MDNCTETVINYYHNTVQHVSLGMQLLCSTISIILVIYTIVFHLGKSWFEGVFKETLHSLYFCILWHDLFTVILQRICIIRVIISVVYPAFPCLHAAVTVQRIVTTYSGDSNMHHLVARACLAVTTTYCIFCVTTGYHNYPLTGKIHTCPGSFTAFKEMHSILSYCMGFLDILNIVIACALIRYNRIKIRKISNASLLVKFRYRQTLRSIEHTLPVAIIHLVSFSTQYILFELKTPFNYTTPYYCVLCSAVLLLIMIREENEKRRELDRINSTSSELNGEEYFQSLQLQWETQISQNNKISQNAIREHRIVPA